MSERLDKALGSVTPESLPGNEDVNPNSVVEPDLGTDPSDQNSTGDNKEKTGRTVENVRGELTRKLEQQQSYFRGQLTSMSEKVDRLLLAMDKSPASSTPNSLDDLSVADLKQYRDKVPDEQRAAFDEYLDERRINEAVKTQVNSVNNRNSFAEQERAANTEAISRWRDLRDPTSTLYAETNKILANYGSAADSDPRAVLSAANEAGLRLGLTPHVVNSPRVMDVKRGANGSSNAPVSNSNDTISRPELDKIANSLGSAFKGGKISDEMMERIIERTKDYQKHKDSFLK